jgi:hypothetical protein
LACGRARGKAEILKAESGPRGKQKLGKQKAEIGGANAEMLKS